MVKIEGKTVRMNPVDQFLYNAKQSYSIVLALLGSNKDALMRRHYPTAL